MRKGPAMLPEPVFKNRNQNEMKPTKSVSKTTETKLNNFRW